MIAASGEGTVKTSDMQQSSDAGPAAAGSATSVITTANSQPQQQSLAGLSML